MTPGDVLEGRAKWSVSRADSLQWLKTLPDKSVDALICDPPYSSGGQFRGDRTASTNSKYTQTGTGLERPDFLGDNRDQRGQLAWLSLWLADCARIVKPGGAACVFTDWRMLPTTTDAFQAGGFVWRGIWVWDKTDGVRPVMGRFRNQCEYVVWGSVGAMPDGEEVGVLPGVARQAVSGQVKLHIAGKPVPVMEALCRICPPGGVVLDPFAGSASTGEAALRLGRRFIGCELDAHWHKVACERLEGSLQTKQETTGDLFGGTS